MNERERAVEAVLKAAMRLARIQDEASVVHNEGSPIADLRLAARALDALDAAQGWVEPTAGCEMCRGSGKVPSGVYEMPPEPCPDCKPHPASRPVTVTDPAKIRRVLDACTEPPPSVEPTAASDIIAAARAHTMTDDERAAQRASFAKGNVDLSREPDLLAADAARAEAKRTSDWVDEQDRAKIPDIIDRLMDDSEAFFWYASDRRGRSGIRSSSQHGTNYIGGERSAIARLLYRRSDLNPLAANVEPADDPQATPAAETVTDTDAPAGFGLKSLASRVAEVERLGAAHERRRSDHEIWVADKIKTYEDDIAALRRDVEAMKGTGPCVCKSTTPAPDALPFGCVARRKSDGWWQVENDEGTLWWYGTSSQDSSRWSPLPNERGWAVSEAEAIADFHATNKGVAPPGEAKGRYEVVDAGGSQWIVRDKRTGYMYVAHTHGWTNADHYSTFRVADIAEAVRDALEARKV